MRRWNLILRVFMAEYLNLRPDDKNARDSTIKRSASDLVSDNISQRNTNINVVLLSIPPA